MNLGGALDSGRTAPLFVYVALQVANRTRMYSDIVQALPSLNQRTLFILLQQSCYRGT